MKYLGEDKKLKTKENRRKMIRRKSKKCEEEKEWELNKNFF